MGGDFIGGCDILMDMHKSGELIEELKKVGIQSALLDKPDKDKAWQWKAKGKLLHSSFSFTTVDWISLHFWPFIQAHYCSCWKELMPKQIHILEFVLDIKQLIHLSCWHQFRPTIQLRRETGVACLKLQNAYMQQCGWKSSRKRWCKWKCLNITFIVLTKFIVSVKTLNQMKTCQQFVFTFYPHLNMCMFKDWGFSSGFF